VRALVLGGSGFLGMNLVLALRERGILPLCTYRGRAPRVALRRAGVPLVWADFEDHDSLFAALRGVEVVFHCGAHYPALSLDRAATLALGLRQLDNVLTACAEAKVRRLVFVSSVATVRAADGSSTEEHTFEAPPGFGVYHDLKWHLERRVLDETRFETVTLCPGACLGPWDVRIGTSGMLVAVARGEAVPHPDGWVNIADARDVAEIAVRVATLQAAEPRLLVAGSNHRFHDLLSTLAARYDAPAPPPPLTALEAIERAEAAERAAAAAGTRSDVSRELVDLTIHGSPIDASLAERLTGHRYRPIEDTLDAFDQWARARNIIPRINNSERSTHGRCRA